MIANSVEVGDLVQVEPESDKVFGGAILTVTEVKSWGVQGYVFAPGHGYAYYRCNHGDYAHVGKTEWFYKENE